MGCIEMMVCVRWLALGWWCVLTDGGIDGAMLYLNIMIGSVIYRGDKSRLNDATSSFLPSPSPVVQIILAKAVLFVTIFLIGDLLSQVYSSMIIALGAGLEFWITKNLGRIYLQASWSIDCEGEEDVWIYEANFKSPSKYEEIFWYSQIVYAVGLGIAAVIVGANRQFSLATAVAIAFGANYINFFAFSKIITLRNEGVLDKIAEEVGAVGEMKETIKIPMMHQSKMQRVNMGMVESSYYVRLSGHSEVNNRSRLRN
jgi:hypothetical protein